MSGTPRCDAGIGVLPVGRTSWKDGRLNTWLNPPPESIQPTSALPALQRVVGGPARYVRACRSFACGSVHRYVPPTPVTSGSEAGQPTDGNGIVRGFLTGSL